MFYSTIATYSLVQVILNLTRLGFNQLLHGLVHRLRQLLGGLDPDVLGCVLGRIAPLVGLLGVG